MITREYIVIGRYIAQGATGRECEEELAAALDEVFMDYSVKEVK